MNNSAFVGWDIGGAHLKVACVSDSGKVDFVKQYATPLWQGLDQLENKFPGVLNDLPSKSVTHAVTMTAELADIFSDREEGINSLINISEKNLGGSTKFYSTKQSFLNVTNARHHSGELASANWHASATFVANKLDAGLFIDIGSTTTDIIPFQDGKLINRGNEDQSRMRYDELLYTGVVRTPLMALTQKAPFNGTWQSIVAEHFSTTADVYRILDELQDTDDLMDTPDSKPKDIPSSIRRLARMVGMDVADITQKYQWIQLAEYFSNIQIQMIMNAISRVISISFNNKPTIVGAGAGHFLIKKIADSMELDFIEFYDLHESDKQLQHRCNTCAPAVALAQLSRTEYKK